MNTKLAIQKHIEKHEATNKMYPNRYKEIHKAPCKNCPSIIDKLNGVVDPEVEDTKMLPREQQIKTVFACGWRPSKLCKGYCDEFNIKEEDLV